MVRFYSTHSLFIFFGLLFNVSCNRPKDPKDPDARKTKSEFETVIQKSDSVWQAMITSDNNKISNMKRLVVELGNISEKQSQNMVQTDTLINKLLTVRYDRETMKTSGLIDQYDSVTNRAIFALRQEIQTNPEAVKYQIISQLASEIQQADDSILYFRKEYDRKIDAYNLYVKKNKKEITKNISQNEGLKKYYVFRLTP